MLHLTDKALLKAALAMYAEDPDAEPASPARSEIMVNDRKVRYAVLRRRDGEPIAFYRLDNYAKKLVRTGRPRYFTIRHPFAAA